MNEKETKKHKIDAKNRKEEPINPVWLNIKPIEFQRILNLYGMQYKTYSELRGKSQGWWYSVLRRKKYLSYLDVKTLADYIGIETFEFLLKQIKNEV